MKAESPAAILVVEDSALVRKHLSRVLQRAGICGQVLLAGDGQEALTLLHREAVDLILCDVTMPTMDGFEFLMQKHEEAAFDEIPVIMLTGDEALESKLKCLQEGASDYLVKPVHDEELAARVRIHLQIKDLQDQLRRKNEQLERLACIDSLTGIANRYHFLKTVKRELHRAARHEIPVSLGMADIDFFKKINDAHGHQVGDLALVEVANRLRLGLREHDSLGRYGGEEFGIIFVNADSQGAMIAAERCRRQISDTPLIAGDQELQVTISIGVASLTEPEAEPVARFIGRADEALYLAKRRGRDQVVLASGPAADPSSDSSEPS